MSPGPRDPGTGRRSGRVRAVLWGVAAYVGTVVVLSLLGLSPSVLLVAAVFVVAGTVAVHLDSRLADTLDGEWPRAGASTQGLGRGSDHRTASLARRLADARTATPGARALLVGEVHADLVAAIASRTRRAHGLDPRTDARGLALLPPDLAALVVEPPDDRLLDPDHLAHLLDRTESL